MSEKAWMDVSVIRCPKCGRYYLDASWYVVELESDIECGVCHGVFNTKRQLTDRVMLEFNIDESGQVLEANVIRHL
ncbi:MAG: hypothetical protein AOA65_0355 [Candidatus Bathyarchaeota archaeon BA1]|nr:MAG: hypothetical protein AOA65_0355 [Candidatus Bathyarchaeota archaeon BA1]